MAWRTSYEGSSSDDSTEALDTHAEVVVLREASSLFPVPTLA